MVEHNILETIKDPTDATLGGGDVARYEADQLVDTDTKTPNYIFCKTICYNVGQKDTVGNPAFYSQRLNQRKFTSEMAKIDFHVFFSQCSPGHKYLPQKVSFDKTNVPAVMRTNVSNNF